MHPLLERLGGVSEAKSHPPAITLSKKEVHLGDTHRAPSPVQRESDKLANFFLYGALEKLVGHVGNSEDFKTASIACGRSDSKAMPPRLSAREPGKDV